MLFELHNDSIEHVLVLCAGKFKGLHEFDNPLRESGWSWLYISLTTCDDRRWSSDLLELLQGSITSGVSLQSGDEVDSWLFCFLSDYLF